MGHQLHRGIWLCYPVPPTTLLESQRLGCLEGSDLGIIATTVLPTEEAMALEGHAETWLSSQNRQGKDTVMEAAVRSATIGMVGVKVQKRTIN